LRIRKTPTRVFFFFYLIKMNKSLNENSSMLDLDDTVITDRSIESLQDTRYSPATGINLNEPGDITIIVKGSNDYQNPSESRLEIKGQMLNAVTGLPYGANELAALVNNGIMSLFNKAEYWIASTHVETVRNPGQASTMLGMLRYSNDFADAQGMNQCWVPDTSTTADLANTGFAARQTYIISESTPTGMFSFDIPLSHIFGFCDDYRKVIFGADHQVVLTRVRDDEAIFRDAAVPAGKIVLSEVNWWLPSAVPDLVNKEMLLSRTASSSPDNMLEVDWRDRYCEAMNITPTTSFTWQLQPRLGLNLPRYLIMGFQTGNQNDQTFNSAVFNHVDLTSIRCNMNTVSYPKTDYVVNFTTNQYSRVYTDMVKFKKDFFVNTDTHRAGTSASGAISTLQFKTLFPIFVIDVSKQTAPIVNGQVNLTLEMNFSTPVPAATKMYTLIISDRKAMLSPSGAQFQMRV